jgi:putative tricarboxylic transport membrane protein
MAERLMAAAVAILGIALVGGLAVPAAAWEPTKPVEFVVPAGTGGGADQMARLIAPLVDKYKLSPRPLVVVNKSGGAGAEGFTYVKAKSGDAHTIIITLSNLFTTPLHTGVPFNWKDLTPVARLALDEFILWVNTDRPDKQDFKTAKDYLAAVKAASGGDGKMKMGGTGTAQEDQIITVLLEQALGVKFIYVPFKGGRVRPLAVFDTKRLTAPGWGDIPTVKEALGADISYLMLRGIFGAPNMPAEAVAFYQGMLQKVYETPEFKEYLAQGALNPAWQTGPEFVKWLEGAEVIHKDLMSKGGLLGK